MLQNILTALAVVVNGIPQGLLALTYGFAAFPTAIAFVIGMAGSAAFNSVATISFQAETITLAGTMGKDRRERLSLVFWGAILLLVPSLLGLNEAIVAFIGPIIVTSMISGRSVEAVSELAGTYADAFENGPLASAPLADIGYTLALRRTHHERRAADCRRKPRGADRAPAGD